MNNEPLNNSEYKKKAEKAIDWLGKQCEPNPYSGVSFKYNGHTWGMCGSDGVVVMKSKYGSMSSNQATI